LTFFLSADNKIIDALILCHKFGSLNAKYSQIKRQLIKFETIASNNYLQSQRCNAINRCKVVGPSIVENSMALRSSTSAEDFMNEFEFSAAFQWNI
jgi:hypothetical protein